MDKEEKKKKTEQKDELMENDRCYPVEQVSNTGEPVSYTHLTLPTTPYV